jgi:uncharacterized protein (TIGR02145 family)
MEKILSISLLIATIAIVSVSCNKDEDDSSLGNSTNGKTTAEFSSNVTYGTMTDQDGNVYKTVTIGTQTWMAENLRTIKYNDGTAITNVTGYNEWGVLTTGAYCNYNNTTSEDSIATYGRLYNWYAVKTGKLAPEGWHVPTDAEWSTLIYYHTGGASLAGGKLKEIGTTHWAIPNEGATNESGFTALPSGFRFSIGGFYGIDGFCYWWCSTELSEFSAHVRSVNYLESSIEENYYLKGNGLSVRCIKD